MKSVMNRFLTKKKTREDLASDAKGPRSSNDAAAPAMPPPPSSKKRWGRKKSEPEHKPPQVDITAALPSSDDFRTSLLLPNLSARFSMLREQDDPSSMLGKASDDSVLQSSRRSGFGFSGTNLSDIDEVSSFKEVPRPSFAPGGRSGSYQTDGDYPTDDESINGSIMSRSRPGEGNMLFGGRQKVYKIPIGDSGAVTNMGAGDARGMRGRALYDDDVSLSSFQKVKERERQAERERRLAEMERELAGQEATAKDGLNSPSMSNYDEKRDTTSSTNSGPSMMSSSTAATSIASQGGLSAPSGSPAFPPASHSQSPVPGLQRSNSRRLYEQGLNQHMSEQQAAALNRIHEIQRKNSAHGRAGYLQQSRSASNLRDRYENVSSASSRAASPLTLAPEKLAVFEGGKNSNNGSPLPGGSTPSPISPAFSPAEGENPLAMSMAPADRGKATALGTFNRPKQFDENQYLMRQRSLHQQKADPRPRPRAGSSARPQYQGRPSYEAKYSTNPRPSVESQARSRAGTNQSDRSWSASPAGGNTAVTSPGASSPVKGAMNGVSPKKPLQIPNRPFANNTFFNSPQTDDDDSPVIHPNRQDEEPSTPAKVSFERGTADDLPPPLRRGTPDLSHHPAMRSTSTSSPEDSHPAPPESPVDNFPPSKFQDPNIPDIGVDDSNTIGMAQTTDEVHLSGLRGHLRQISNVSSIYHSDTTEVNHPEMPDFDETVKAAYDTPANPWEDDSKPVPVRGEAPQFHRKHSTTSSASKRSDPALRPGSVSSRYEDRTTSAEDLRQNHTRGASTETQAEREAFDHELLQRQRAIQANLKIKSEANTRSPSPAGTPQKMKPFGVLRNKSSRDSLKKQDKRQDEPPSKAMRMLGLNPNPTSIPPGGHGKGANEDPRRVGRDTGNSPMGRTLHSRMPQRHDGPGPGPGPRVGGPNERVAPKPRSPPDPSPTSASRDAPSSSFELSSERGRPGMPPSGDPHRREHPSAASSTNTSGRPSVDSNRKRSEPGPPRPRPSVPNLRTQTAPNRPGASAAPPPRNDSPASTTSAPAQTFSPSLQTSSSFTSLAPSSVRPSISASASTADLRGQTNTSLAQTPTTQNVPPPQSAIPASAYTFAGHHAPAAQQHLKSSSKGALANGNARRGRAPTVNKGDISQPSLISSTSSFDNTIDLSVAQNSVRARDSPIMMSTSNNGTGAAQASGGAPPTSNGQTSPPPPPIPPVNPKRRHFMHFGRSKSPENDEGNTMGGASAFPPMSPPGNNSNTNNTNNGGIRSPKMQDDEFFSKADGTRMRIRKISSSERMAGGGRRHEAVVDASESDGVLRGHHGANGHAQRNGSQGVGGVDMI
ncbi:MAG: hypothetical protein M1831_006733 [Alyxoria varia]|nr:MAG: hypothetical protein M1831_006733 [Alyxoria varia]